MTKAIEIIMLHMADLDNSIEKYDELLDHYKKIGDAEMIESVERSRQQEVHAWYELSKVRNELIAISR